MSDRAHPPEPVPEELLDAQLPEEPLSRRAFVKVGLGCMGAVYAAAIGYPVYRYLATPALRAGAAAAVTEVVLDKADQLPAGTALMFKFGSRPAMLIHHEDGSWVAFSAKCTHLGCTVQFEPKQQRIFCACHNGVYDMKTGANVSGPPPKPLERYQVEVADGQVIVSRA